MATLLEFNELGPGQQLGLQTTDRGIISGVAVDPAALPSTVGGLVTFLTVARASAKRMLDAPLAQVSSWIDGQPLYTSSCGGAGWHWQADFPSGLLTDNITTCRPTSWVAGGLNGACVRGLEGNRTSLLATAWFVNSTATDNEGAGTALDPVQTAAEILRRFGPGEIYFPDNVTFNFAQAPTSPIVGFHLGVTNLHNIIFQGTPTSSQENVVITAVTAQVRTPGSEVALAITGATLGAADVGKLAIIVDSATPGHIGAYAYVIEDQTAGKVGITPFGFASEDFTVFSQITPSVGDTIDIVVPMTLPVASIVFNNQTTNFVPFEPVVTPLDCVVFRDCTVAGTDGNGGITANGISVYYERCIWQSLMLYGDQHPSANSQVLAGGGVSGFVDVHTSAGIYKSGVLNCFVNLAPGAIFICDTDSYFQNSGTILFAGTSVASYGTAFWDRASANNALVVQHGAEWNQFGAVPDWGTGNAGHGIKIASLGGYTYVTKPTINGTLGAGREALIGGTDKVYAAVPFIEPANNAALVAFV
jgi:hypothetical protein